MLKLDCQPTADWQVVCEEPTRALGPDRRHDIFLDGRDWVLSIENKPWAKDQTNQVIDYLQDLKGRRRQNWHLVYLTNDGRPPSGNSIPKVAMEQNQKDGHLILLSFEQLKEWLASCCDQCQAPRVKEFLADFRQYIHEQLLGFAPEKEQTMIVDAVLDGNHLEAALELIRSANSLYGKLLAGAMSKIREELEDWITVSELLVDNYRLALKPPGVQSWTICFQDTDGYPKKWERWISGQSHEQCLLMEKATELVCRLRDNPN